MAIGNNVSAQTALSDNVSRGLKPNLGLQYTRFNNYYGIFKIILCLNSNQGNMKT